MDPKLKNAALNGDVDKLYQVIGQNPDVLDLIDKIPFVETPLHIAASRGHIDFALEILSLKPCFSKKLDVNGLSPMHLALQKKQTLTVLRLLETEDGANLVRIKGRGGVTPLHYVVEEGDLNLLDEFLSVSSDSITDKTNRGKTALHIAVKKGNVKALEALLEFLRSSRCREALYWEEKVLNWKDENGYTVLHVAAEMNQLQMMKLLLKCNIYVNARNLNGKTALDIVTKYESVNTTEMKDLLIRAGALNGRLNQSNETDTISMKKFCIKSRLTCIKGLLTQAGALDCHPIQINETDTTSMKQIRFKSSRPFLEDVIRRLKGHKTSKPKESRDDLLMVAALAATATFQAVLSPPGGLRQADSNSDSLPSSNVGKVVMNEWLYMIFLIFNSTSFWVSTIAIFLLLPCGFCGQLLTLLLILLSACYLFCSTVISPSLLCAVINFGLLALFIILLVGLVLLSNCRWYLHQKITHPEQYLTCVTSPCYVDCGANW